MDSETSDQRDALSCWTRARQFLKSGQYAEATRYYLILWTAIESSFELQERGAFLAGEMGILAEKDPNARVAFDSLVDVSLGKAFAPAVEEGPPAIELRIALLRLVLALGHHKRACQAMLQTVKGAIGDARPNWVRALCVVVARNCFERADYANIASLYASLECEARLLEKDYLGVVPGVGGGAAYDAASVEGLLEDLAILMAAARATGQFGAASEISDLIHKHKNTTKKTIHDKGAGKGEPSP